MPDAATLLRDLARPPFAAKSNRAIWQQIADRIQQACRADSLTPGDRLPSEHQMAEIFGVTRVTMRRALGRLQQEGLLQARKGVGIFVRPAFRVDYGNRFAVERMVPDSIVSTRTLAFASGDATEEEAAALALAPGAAVLRLARVRLIDEAPLYMTAKTFPAAVFPDFQGAYARRNSVRDVYAQHGIRRYRRQETRVTGGFATPQEAEALQMTPQTPVLRTISVNIDGTERPIELNRGSWPLTGVELVLRAQEAAQFDEIRDLPDPLTPP